MPSGRLCLVLVACSVACGGSSGGKHGSTTDAGPDVREGGPGPRDARDGGDGTSDVGVADAHPTPDAPGGKDAPTDANPLTELGGCLGPSMPLTLSGQMPYVAVPVGTQSGEFVLDFGSTFSSIDLTAFASPGPTTSGCNRSLLGVTCTVAGFAFFSSPGSVELTTEDFSGLGGSVRQAGIVGTDILSERVITLGYSAGLAFASPSASFCTTSALQSAGLVPLSAKGFYENDVSLLEPAGDVDSSAPSGETVANVPTVPVRIGGADGLAQLDTGFDDDVTPFSVNINPAFYAAIEAKNPSALTRDTSLDTALTTCVSGVSESVTGYRLAAPSTFDFMSVGGASAHSYPNAAVFVKNTPAAAHACGGIGTWSVPAAQVAASYFNDMGVLVFDPYAAEVWIPKR